jgi:hypothetical protein
MKFNKDNIIIKDNFFEETLFQKIKIELSHLHFINRSLDIDKTSKNTYQKIYFHHILTPKHHVVKEVKKHIKKTYKINPIKMKSFYFLSPPNKTPTPHTDTKDCINFLIYLKGNKLINNGTGFYEENKKLNSFDLHTHIGFKENRSIMFSGNKMHSSLQFNDNSSGRYVMTNFIYEYKII